MPPAFATSWHCAAIPPSPERATSRIRADMRTPSISSPACAASQFDLENLRRKLDAGASRAITQFFFDTELFLRFRDRVRRAGIEAPLIPGILPVTNYGQVARFARMCGTAVPAWLTRLFETLEDDPEARKLVAAMVAGEQCRILAAEGVSDFHFYTLNRADLTFAICHVLGLRATAQMPRP